MNSFSKSHKPSLTIADVTQVQHCSGPVRSSRTGTSGSRKKLTLRLSPTRSNEQGNVRCREWSISMKLGRNVKLKASQWLLQLDNISTLQHFLRFYQTQATDSTRPSLAGNSSKERASITFRTNFSQFRGFAHYLWCTVTRRLFCWKLHTYFQWILQTESLSKHESFVNYLQIEQFFWLLPCC